MVDIDLSEYPSKEVRNNLLSLANVHSVGIGYEYRGGRPTGNIAVRVHVAEKVSPEELDVEDRVPYYLDGVSVDVIESEPLTPDFSTDGNPGNDSELQREVRLEAFRPLSGGMRGSAGSVATIAGTGKMLGPNDEVYTVTNRHVACEEEEDCTGEPAYQPDEGLSDSDRFGTIDVLGPFDPNGPNEDNVDAAYIEFDQGIDILNGYYGLGPQIDFEEPEIGKRIVNTGTRTGFNSGVITEIDTTSTVGFDPNSITFEGVFRYKVNTDGGDSGSVSGYVNENGELAPVGCHFAGGADDAVAMPFSKVQDSLGNLTVPDESFTLPEGESSTDLLECSAYDVRGSDNDNLEIRYFVSNTGGTQFTDTVKIQDESEDTIDSRSHTIASGQVQFNSFVVDRSYENEELVLRTTDHVDFIESEAEFNIASVSSLDSTASGVSGTRRRDIEIQSVDVEKSEIQSVKVASVSSSDSEQSTITGTKITPLEVASADIDTATVSNSLERNRTASISSSDSEEASVDSGFGDNTWIFDGDIIGERIEEIREWDLLELVIRYEKSISEDVVQSITNKSDKGSLQTFESGGFRTIDVGNGTNDLNIRPPTSDRKVRSMDTWFLDEYDKSVVDRNADVYDIELSLIPLKHKSFDNEYATISDGTKTRESYQWKFEFEVNEIVTSNVTIDVNEASDGSEDLYTLETFMKPDEVRILEENASYLNLSRLREIPDRTDIHEDVSSDNRNTINVTSPDNVTDPISDGKYLIFSWETEWLSGAYRVEMELGNLE